MKSRKTRNPNKDISSPFTEHITELRSRLFVYAFSLCVCVLIGYVLHSHIIEILTKPLGQPLFYASVTGGFDFVFQISFFFGFLLSVPMLLYQLFRFTEPALPPTSNKKILLYLLASAFLLCVGIAFAYCVSLPSTLFFLGSFSNGNIKTLISTSEYFSFISGYLVGFGIAFQLPLILLFIDSIHTLPMGVLFRQQRIVIVVSFVIAAILTPTPDLVNQTIFALPLILLYQGSLVLIWLQHRSKIR
ncbi:MAG: twin-arginine translocase subunit TatC [Candidatus Woesebacteria bacterium]